MSHSHFHSNIISYIFKTHSEKKVIVGIILTIIGIGLLTLTSEFKIGNGDIFCILSALFYAIHVIITGSVTKHVNSIALGVVQLGFVGLFSLIFHSLSKLQNCLAQPTHG